jgi:hypothetical protein
MQRVSPRSRFLGVFIGITALIATGSFVYAVFPSASNQGYAPEQPIPFSHKLHAGQYQIQCQYCHVGVEKSNHATVPSVNVCMNCHSQVKTDSPWIQKIAEHYHSGKPIEWIRIHELPDHAHFPHRRHIQAGLACQTCHGEVEKMEVVFQSQALNMGWCMDCHRGKTTPIDVLKKKYPDVEDPRGLQVAPLNCTTCHY